MVRKIPKRFEKTGKTFVKRLAKSMNSGAFDSFSAFPPEVSFNGQDDKEDIILLIRKHPASYILKFFLFIALLFFPLLFLTIMKTLMGEDMSYVLWIGSSLVFLLLALTVLMDTYFKWFYSVNIITTERIVDVDFNDVLHHKYAEAQLEKIEDVSHRPVGILSSLFDYGDVNIQTAGTKPEFVFDSVPRPRDVQDTLLDLLELKQSGKI